ncbi:DMT family transporter [Sinomonas sp. JGH33]|uniref:DMT family transporter n=1 Tax=Sinomonas terricola TaxID=3110330 RepID=A0ABU5T321_9MICC|nr:DMT family transporter [Sinomonas sp. JGH33]MEA5454063.1 DMT family transporter [Sinomonas sp. JGH33]
MRTVPAPIFPLIAVLSWGAMFPIAAIAMPHVDAFNITAIRYGVASLIFVIMLALAEGRRAFSLEGRGWRLFSLGSLGFAGFNLLAYLALIWSPPQDVAVIVPTMPLVTVLVRWARGGGRPSPVMLSASVAALIGVFLVVTKGDVTRLSGGLGDVLTFLGVICWVVYTTSAASFPSWSALRFTALTAPLGTVTILAATAVADAFGWQRLPSLADLGAAWWEIAFIVLFGAVAAVLAWNHGVKLLGAANTALFIILVPVVALAMRIAGGYQPTPVELAGIAVVIGALVLANLGGRRAATRALVATAAD